MECVERNFNEQGKLHGTVRLSDGKDRWETQTWKNDKLIRIEQSSSQRNRSALIVSGMLLGHIALLYAFGK